MSHKPRQDDKAEEALRLRLSLTDAMPGTAARSGIDTACWVPVTRLGGDRGVATAQRQYPQAVLGTCPDRHVAALAVPMELKSGEGYTISTKRDLTATRLLAFREQVVVHGVYRAPGTYDDFREILVLPAGALSRWVDRHTARTFGPRGLIWDRLVSPAARAQHASAFRAAGAEAIQQVVDGAILSEALPVTARASALAIDGPEWHQAYNAFLKDLGDRGLTTNQISIGQEDLQDALRYPGAHVFDASTLQAPAVMRQHIEDLIVESLNPSDPDIQVRGNGGRGAALDPAAQVWSDMTALVDLHHQEEKRLYKWLDQPWAEERAQPLEDWQNQHGMKTRLQKYLQACAALGHTPPSGPLSLLDLLGWLEQHVVFYAHWLAGRRF